MAKPPECEDCVAAGVVTWRPPVPGAARKRCATHKREFDKASKERAHRTHVNRVYGLGEDITYDNLLEFQGGTCAICRKATGKARRLAVDHDHDSGDPRGILCGPDNLLLGRLGTEGLIRALTYLADPPYAQFRRALREIEERNS